MYLAHSIIWTELGKYIKDRSNYSLQEDRGYVSCTALPGCVGRLSIDTTLTLEEFTSTRLKPWAERMERLQALQADLQELGLLE